VFLSSLAGLGFFSLSMPSVKTPGYYQAEEVLNRYRSERVCISNPRLPRHTARAKVSARPTL